MNFDIQNVKYDRPKGKVTDWCLRSSFVSFLLDIAQALVNLRAGIQQTDGQNVTGVVWAKKTISADGLTLMFPPFTTASSGGSGNQVFGGNGPPSAATLPAGNYVSGQNPNCYVDESNNNFWYCSTAGTASTSAWTQISGNSSNWNYRGAYQGGSTYNEFDVVQFGAGIGAGMYLCTANANNTNPQTGTGWVQVSSTTGVWL